LPITSALDVPLIHNGELIGNFLVGNKDGDYDDHDRRLLENICEYIGPVLYARRERDVQQKKSRELESHLRQAQKMQSIGTLASGIAHDFNNILSSIMGYTSLAMEEVKKGTSLYDNLSEVQSAGNRAARLVQQILTISRPGEQEMESISIAPLIKETLKMVRSTIPSSIELKPYICSEPLIVRADATQLHQVLLNLVTNAGQSMVDENGVLEIRLEAVHCDAECGHRCPGMSPGDYACITVSDTGQGIDAAHLDRIFEPYFTTREKGEGTGLGLFVVHGIVQSLKGCITVDSEIGQGTTFRVCLPLMQEATRLAPPSAVEKTVPAGKESILVVDDELPIVNMLQQTFERQGYQVIAKTSSIEAMVTFRALPDRFDLVVTDMTMPYMSGEKLARTIKEIRPDVPVILCTGFSKKINRQPLPPEIDGFLMKPVDPVKISRMVRDMLDLKNGKIENGKP
jgi:signal transduction histidine kinase